MANLFVDMVQMAVSGTPGTGTVTLAAATAGYRTMVTANAQDGGPYSYTFTDASNAWETGWGIYSSAGTTITRNLIASSTGLLLSLTSAAIFSVTLLSGDLTPDLSTPPGNGAAPFP